MIQTELVEIKVTRTQGWCSQCQKWFCPGDEALGVESGYSPVVQEMAVLFASKMPLAEASAVLERAARAKSWRRRRWTGWPSRPREGPGKAQGDG